MSWRLKALRYFHTIEKKKSTAHMTRPQGGKTDKRVSIALKYKNVSVKCKYHIHFLNFVSYIG